MLSVGLLVVSLVAFFSAFAQDRPLKYPDSLGDGVNLLVNIEKGLEKKLQDSLRNERLLFQYRLVVLAFLEFWFKFVINFFFHD